MAISVTGKLENFYPNSVIPFRVTIKYNGVAQDIRQDVVTAYIKASSETDDGDALIVATAEVATEGISGIAIFELSQAQTNVPSQKAWCKIVWARADGDVHTIYGKEVTILVV